MAAHKTRIEVHYNLEKGYHEWWFVCGCGAKGEKRMSPNWAERDADRHAGTVAGVKE